MTEPEITTLSNGIVVAVDAMPHLNTASTTIQFRGGSRYDPEDLPGLAHLTEHMLFKGAGSRVTGRLDEDVEDVGADLNAWTDRDHMALTMTSLVDHVPLAIEVMSEMLLDPHVPKKELGTEKKVVLAEMADCQKDERIVELAYGTAYRDQAFGRAVIGTKEGVRGATPEAIRAWLSSRLDPARMVVSVTGPVDPGHVVDLVATRFGLLPPREGEEIEAPAFREGRAMARGDDAQADISMVWNGPTASSDGRHAWAMTASVLGGGGTSRLFRRLRDDLGLCYDVSAHSIGNRDTGQFVIDVSTDRRKARTTHDAILQVIAETAGDIGQRELDRARTLRKAAMLMARDNAARRSAIMASSLMERGRVIPLDEALAGLDAVTLDDVRAIAASLRDRPRVTANVGGGSLG